MDLSDYLRVFRRLGWLIVVLAILTSAGAFAFSKMQEPEYKASVNLLVRPARTDLGAAEATKRLLRGYVVWLNSSYRAQSVIDNLSLDKDPNALKGKAAFSADDSNFTIKIEIRDPNQQNAADIARVWGDLLVQETDANNATQRKEDRIVVQRQDDPVSGLYRPNTKINTAAGAVFGALLGVILIFLLEWIQSGKVRRAEDIEKYLDVPVIGKIPS